eukprot:scaffold1588_cov214-Alexandrium_tamarense.AAC.2
MKSLHDSVGGVEYRRQVPVSISTSPTTSSTPLVSSESDGISFNALFSTSSQQAPSRAHSKSPINPTSSPSRAPSTSPINPTSAPSRAPSTSSINPTSSPSNNPTSAPSAHRTESPTPSPSKEPTTSPIKSGEETNPTKVHRVNEDLNLSGNCDRLTFASPCRKTRARPPRQPRIR